MNRPKALDLFCGAGGMSMGLHQAGFDVTGVDIRPMPRYPFPFIQADALTVDLSGYQVIAASPPCQGYSRMRHLPWLKGREYPMLIDATRERLMASGAVWVIENVEDAPLQGITLCGLQFGLKVYRHRKFESNVLLLAPPHLRHEVVIGSGRNLNDRRHVHADGWMSAAAHGNNYRETMGAAMGIDWMTREELSQAIPPAYGKFIGEQLMAAVERGAA